MEAGGGTPERRQKGDFDGEKVKGGDMGEGCEGSRVGR